MAVSSGSNKLGVVPLREGFDNCRLCCCAELLLVRRGFGGGDVEPADGLMSLSPLKFHAVWGNTVGVMSPSVQGHGACPQGKHKGSAVLGIADVSVHFLVDLCLFSELQ